MPPICRDTNPAKRPFLETSKSSSLALVAVTVWMVVDDHQRPWKEYQKTYRDRVEPWLTEARIAERTTEEYLARERELADGLAAAHARDMKIYFDVVANHTGDVIQYVGPRVKRRG